VSRCALFVDVGYLREALRASGADRHGSAARLDYSALAPVLGDFVAGEGMLPEEQVELSLRSEALAAALEALGGREREVLVLRYGLADHEPRTLEEIGRRLGLTRERVRQIEVEALRRLSTLREIEAVSH